MMCLNNIWNWLNFQSISIDWKEFFVYFECAIDKLTHSRNPFYKIILYAGLSVINLSIFMLQ